MHKNTNPIHPFKFTILPGTEFAKKLWGGQSLLFAFRWRHHVHTTTFL